MDRISALRNVEEALQEFENGEIDLLTMDVRIRSVIRTYATSFGAQRAYRAAGPPAVEGVIVAADTPETARERIAALEDTQIDRSEIVLTETS